MSKWNSVMLRTLSNEIVTLGERVVSATAIVFGQGHDFSQWSGSAWLYSDIHLVTNFHVIDGLEDPIHLRMPAHPKIKVSVVASDSYTDLAVVALPEPVASPLELCRTTPSLGELCFAFGSPLGEYPESMTMGIVSGLHRQITSPGGRVIDDVIQTDAAINHGNSGGPLVDVDGCVIGVNSQGLENAASMGFAVPASTVADIVPELLEHGSVLRASLGLSVATRVVDSDHGREERVVVSAVKDNSAGPFQSGDVLLRIGQKDVRRQGDLFRLLRRDLIGNEVSVEVWRDGKSKIIECRPSKLIGDTASK